MYGQKLCLATGVSSSLTEEEQIMLYKRTGFDGFFVGYGNDEHIQSVAALAKRENLIFQSIHAPFGRVDKLWLEAKSYSRNLSIASNLRRKPASKSS